MYIIDGIAYAGDAPDTIKVQNVRALDGHKLLVGFNNGQRRIFDFAELLEMPCYKPLRDKSVFDKACVERGIVCWADGDIDIAPETLYERGIEYRDEETA